MGRNNFSRKQYGTALEFCRKTEAVLHANYGDSIPDCERGTQYSVEVVFCEVF